MATFGIENGSVDNRGFNSTGLAQKFKDWVVKTPSNHGPGWYIYDDQSALGTNPYIVVCNQSSPSVNSKAMFIRVQVDSSTERLTFASTLRWNNSTHSGLSFFQSNDITTVTGSFAYYFRGGQDLIMMITRIGASISHARLSRWVGIWDGTKGTEPETTSGVLSQPSNGLTDPGGYFSSPAHFYQITNVGANIDANSKLYFTINPLSSTTYNILIYKDSARTQLIGTSATFGTTAPNAYQTITANNGSGLGGSIYIGFALGTSHAAVSNIDCTFLQLVLGSGQGANFRVGKYYFVNDCNTVTTNPTTAYFKVLSKNGDTLNVDRVNNWYFGVGSNVGAYPHRWMQSGSSGGLSSNSHFPYNGTYGQEINVNGGYCQAGFDYPSGVLTRVNPDDEGDYAAAYYWLYEVLGNRYWGKEINVIGCAGGGMAALQDRRIINGVPYLAFSTGSLVSLVLDQESLT